MIKEDSTERKELADGCAIPSLDLFWEENHSDTLKLLTWENLEAPRPALETTGSEQNQNYLQAQLDHTTKNEYKNDKPEKRPFNLKAVTATKIPSSRKADLTPGVMVNNLWFGGQGSSKSLLNPKEKQSQKCVSFKNPYVRPRVSRNNSNCKTFSYAATADVPAEPMLSLRIPSGISERSQRSKSLQQASFSHSSAASNSSLSAASVAGTSGKGTSEKGTSEKGTSDRNDNRMPSLIRAENAHSWIWCPCEKHEKRMKAYLDWNRQRTMKRKASNLVRQRNVNPMDHREAFPRHEEDFNPISTNASRRIRNVKNACQATWQSYRIRHPSSAQKSNNRRNETSPVASSHNTSFLSQTTENSLSTFGTQVSGSADGRRDSYPTQRTSSELRNLDSGKLSGNSELLNQSSSLLMGASIPPENPLPFLKYPDYCRCHSRPSLSPNSHQFTPPPHTDQYGQFSPQLTCCFEKSNPFISSQPACHHCCTPANFQKKKCPCRCPRCQSNCCKPCTCRPKSTSNRLDDPPQTYGPCADAGSPSTYRDKRQRSTGGEKMKDDEKSTQNAAKNSNMMRGRKPKKDRRTPPGPSGYESEMSSAKSNHDPKLTRHKKENSRSKDSSSRHKTRPKELPREDDAKKRTTLLTVPATKSGKSIKEQKLKKREPAASTSIKITSVNDQSQQKESERRQVDLKPEPKAEVDNKLKDKPEALPKETPQQEPKLLPIRHEKERNLLDFIESPVIDVAIDKEEFIQGKQPLISIKTGETTRNLESNVRIYMTEKNVPMQLKKMIYPQAIPLMCSSVPVFAKTVRANPTCR